jgi:subtilisin-like proprotein convertase family protein
MKIKLLLIFSLFYLQLSAQNFPTDDRIALTVESLDMVQKMTMPALNNQTLLDAELQRRGPGIAPKYAENMEVDIRPDTHGNWEDLSDGNSVWRMKIESAGAKSLNLGFTKYIMPDGGTLILYSPNYDRVMGPFTPADNEEHEQLWTPVLDGDELVIEVQVPTVEKPNLQLELSYVNHDFLGFTTVGSAMISGSCNLDVICGEADGWGIVDNYRDIIQSVAVIGMGGGTFCTGFLVNNVNNDCKPFFMTANHCGVNNGNAASLVTYWNFFNSTCREPGSGASGGNGDGSLADFNTGSIFRASYAPSDMTLVELDDPVSETADAFFAGWSAEFEMPQDTIIAVHHPSTDEKRISFEFDPAQPGNGLNPNVVDISNATHVIIPDWDIGTTEGGSSGSPIFNNQKQVVGQLHGGGAACGNNAYDTYGWFHASWEGGGTSATRLKDWLDPDDTGVLNIAGRSQQQCSFFVDAAPTSVEVCMPADAVYNLSATESFAGDVTLSVTGLPVGATAVFAENPIVPGGSTTLTISNLGGTAAGTYTLELEGTDGANSNTNNLTLTTFAGVPGLSPLQLPTLGAMDVSTSPTFEWDAESGVMYEIEIATDNNFTTVVESATNLTSGNYQSGSLNTETMYFWRVKGANLCGDGNFSNTHFFTTANVLCGSNISSDIPIMISENGQPTVTSNLEVTTSGLIDDLNINNLTIEHTWVGDLEISLTSPSNTTVLLYNGGVTDCNQDNFEVSLDDDAPNPYSELEGMCNNNPPAVAGFFQPAEALSTFNGEPANGTWTLTVIDNVNNDGGQLTNWELDICSIVVDDFSFSASPSTVASCIDDMITFDVTIGGAFDDANGVTLSANNLPAGATATFSENPASPGSTVTVTLENVTETGGFSIEIIGDDGVNPATSAGVIWNINGPPAVTTLMMPNDNAMDQPLNITMEWEAIAGVNTYNYVLATDPDFNNIVSDVPALNNSLLQNNLEFGTTYYWMVTTVGDCGETASEVFSFTTFPDLTATVSPGSQTVCVSEEVVFTIEIGNGFGTATITADNLPGAAMIDYSMNPASGGSTVTATLSNLVTVSEGTYTIDFIIEDDNGTTNESATITVETPPLIADLNSPENGADMVALSDINFNWEDIAGVSSYLIEIASDEDFTDVIESDNVTGNSYTSTIDLEEETLYFWRVTANNPCGSAVSLVFNFTTEDANSTYEVQGVALTLQPNPTRDFVNISLSAPLNEMIATEVYAINGQLLQTTVFNGNATQHQLDLSNYSAGVYLVKIVTGNEAIVERVVLEK